MRLYDIVYIVFRVEVNSHLIRFIR